MLRSSLLGALAFGLTAAVAGFLWTTFEFPFAILISGALGWLVVTWTTYGPRKSLLAGLLGGTTFTAAFLVGIFFAITDGSPFALPAWLAAAAAAALAGGLTGALLAGRRGATMLALFSAAGMLVGEVLAWLVQVLSPASIDVPGPAQTLLFTLAIGLVGTALGAFIGAGLARLNKPSPDEVAMTTGKRGLAA